MYWNTQCAYNSYKSSIDSIGENKIDVNCCKVAQYLCGIDITYKI